MTINNYKYNGKELQETGMYDYGARMYMPDIGRWNGLDAKSEKYTRISPYSYVGNNPAVFVDYDGKDFGISINMKAGTITVTGNYYALSRDMNSAKGAIDKWNSASGKYSYTYRGGDGTTKSLKVILALTATEVKSNDRTDLKSALDGDKSGIANSFTVDDKRMKSESSTTEGVTSKGKFVTVRSTSTDDTGGHEIGHTFGLNDEGGVSSGIMTHTTESGDSINSNYIQSILSYYDGNMDNPNQVSDKTQKDGNPSSVVIDSTNSNLKTNKDYENFKKGKVKTTPME